MEVFNFMPYTYYTRMTVPGGKSRNVDYILIAAKRRYHNLRAPRARQT